MMSLSHAFEIVDEFTRLMLDENLNLEECFDPAKWISLYNGAVTEINENERNLFLRLMSLEAIEMLELVVAFRKMRSK